jgi:hypothetical protein
LKSLRQRRSTKNISNGQKLSNSEHRNNININNFQNNLPHIKNPFTGEPSILINLDPSRIVFSKEILIYYLKNYTVDVNNILRNYEFLNKKKKKMAVLPHNEEVINSYIKYEDYYNKTSNNIRDYVIQNNNVNNPENTKNTTKKENTGKKQTEKLTDKEKQIGNFEINLNNEKLNELELKETNIQKKIEEANNIVVAEDVECKNNKKTKNLFQIIKNNPNMLTCVSNDSSKNNGNNINLNLKKYNDQVLISAKSKFT